VAALVEQCDPGFTAAGAFETTSMEVAVANSEGQFCWAPSTLASITTVISGGDHGNGFAETFGARVSELDPEAIGKRAAQKARDSQNPQDLEPGRYTVILEPSAVSTPVGFLAWIGFGGRMLAEGRSCFSGKEGESVAARKISIFDVAASPLRLGTPFVF
jgi:PmbA protein